jgi:acid phosphatase family membrane protein YuiD
MLLLAMAAVVPPSPADLLSNKVFMAGFVAWFGAQFGKVSMRILYQS